MLIVRVILAAAAVGSAALGRRSPRGTAAVAAAAALDTALGAPVGAALATVAPVACFLAAALTLAAIAERSGLMERAAGVLAARAGGSAPALYGLVCALTALMTALLSLDGAIVLAIPLLRELARRHEAPFAPLFLGSVVVANAASVVVPQGNPTNLVVIERMGISPAAFTAHMLVPGLAATLACAAAVAVRERRALRRAASRRSDRRAGRNAGRNAGRWSSTEHHAAASLTAAAVALTGASAAGIPPWWPFAAVVALAAAVRRPWPRPALPWRVAVDVAGLLVVIGALGLPVPAAPGGTAGLVALAAGIGACCAVANNLPIGAAAASLLASGPAAYAASIGLAVGALATPQGSVATLIAADLAGPDAPPLRPRTLAPLAAGGVLVATLLLGVSL